MQVHLLVKMSGVQGQDGGKRDAMTLTEWKSKVGELFFKSEGEPAMLLSGQLSLTEVFIKLCSQLEMIA